MPYASDDETAVLRALLDGTDGWWSSARLDVVRAEGLLPVGAARLVLRRPLMGVPAGVRVEDADGRVLARGLGEELDDRAGLRALLDPLALATALPPAVGALPPRARRDAVAALDLREVRRVRVDDVAAVRGVVLGLVDQDAASVVLEGTSGLPLEVGPSGGLPVLALRLEELDPRLEDDTFTG